uniref:Retrotransposon protein, putative, Ty3-gypsy subclass n=1 Tax=Oryza sativa subsp. japonica TaxID=39947 RepID=Q2QP31_ORYSJ|nr:retrotransposon protein, putative, Ty3-gypsy subclass [Oryza sativa Japonica Group]
MELVQPGCPVDRLPDSPRHERGAARCLLGTGVNPEVWCDRLERVMRRVLSRPLSGDLMPRESIGGDGSGVDLEIR